MADDTKPQVPGPDTTHTRVKRGYWPEKFGDVEVTIDLDHPQADKVRTRAEIDAEKVQQRTPPSRPRSAQ